jgi:hypothetical protein
MQTKTWFLLLLVGCASESEKKLPSAQFTPQVQTASDVACGEDIAFYGNTSPDLRYTFAYDSGGRIQSANGVWVADNVTDTTAYTWTGDNVTHILSTSGWDGSTATIDATYHATNGLTNYSYAVAGPNYNETWTYVMSDFAAPYMPQHEAITGGGQTYGYDLTYADDRLVAAVPNGGGMSTTWSYDDAAGTITANTGNGAYVNVTTYDTTDFRMLGSSWNGSDASVIDGDEAWAWNGDSLDSVTYRSGSEDAPHTLGVVQVDTLRYNCASARVRAGGSRVHANLARANWAKN